jgi:hypothetical protein
MAELIGRSLVAKLRSRYELEPNGTPAAIPKNPKAALLYTTSQFAFR